MPTTNKKLKAKHQKAWYEKHREEHKKKVYEGKIRRRKEMRKYLNFLGFKCKNCGEDDGVVLDFHHRNPKEKDFEVSVMICSGYSLKRIINEIEKCDVLCANCHRREHYKLKQGV